MCHIFIEHWELLLALPSLPQYLPDFAKENTCTWTAMGGDDEREGGGREGGSEGGRKGQRQWECGTVPVDWLRVVYILSTPIVSILNYRESG